MKVCVCAAAEGVCEDADACVVRMLMRCGVWCCCCVVCVCVCCVCCCAGVCVCVRLLPVCPAGR